MKTFTYQQLLSFIDKQPDNRAIDFKQANSLKPIGCLLVQFGKEELGLTQIFDCGIYGMCENMSTAYTLAEPSGTDKLHISRVIAHGLVKLPKPTANSNNS